MILGGSLLLYSIQGRVERKKESFIFISGFSVGCYITVVLYEQTRSCTIYLCLLAFDDDNLDQISVLLIDSVILT